MKQFLFILALIASFESISARNPYRNYQSIDSLFIALARGEYKPMLSPQSTLKTRIEWHKNRKLDSLIRLGQQYLAQKDTYVDVIIDKALFEYDSIEHSFSIEFSNYDTTVHAWYRSTIHKEFYSETDELLKLETYSFDTVTNNWYPSTVSKYESIGDTTFVLNNSFSTDTKSWYLYSKSKNVGPQDGKLLYYEYVKWNRDSLAWENKYQTYNTYNLYGHVTTNGTINYNPQTNTYDTIALSYYYEYDVNGNTLVSKKYQHKNGNETLVNSSHYSDFIAPGKPSFSIDSVWNSNANAFTESYRKIHTYDTNGLSDSTLLYQWSTETNELVFYGILSNTYTAQGDIIKESHQYYDETGDLMHDDFYELSYTKYGEICHEIFSYWSYPNTGWISSYDNTFYFPIQTESIDIEGTEITIVFDDYLQPGDAQEKVTDTGSFSVEFADVYIAEAEPDKLVISLASFPDDGEYATISGTDLLKTIDGRIATFTLAIGNDPDTGLEQFSAHREPTLYPSVCTNSLTVCVPDGLAQWSITNISGEIVAKGTSNGNTQCSISTAAMISGSYFFTVDGYSIPFVKR